MKDLSERPENRLPFLVLLFDLRLEQEMHMIRHHTGSVEFVDLVERSSITPEIKLPEDLF